MVRKYEQRLRAVSADETRHRVLDALAKRLRESPAEPVSVECIAQSAGVSRSTIYLVFGSRAGMFAALAGELLERGGFGRMLQEAAHPDARQGLRRGIHAAVEMYASERDLLRALISRAQLETEAVGDGLARMEHGRAIGARYRAQRLGDQQLLRSDVTVEEAVNVLWVLTSFDVFDLLYTGRKLSVDAVADLLANNAERSLCVSNRGRGDCPRPRPDATPVTK